MAGSYTGFNPLRLVLSIVITEGSGGLGSVFTYGAINTWYASLNRSALTPPNWLFAPMWISLYFIMGISLYLVWNREGKSQDKALGLFLFGTQLALNVLWSLIFFGLHSILFGLIEIVFLWFFIVATIIEFYPVDKKASYLLFPYISWVTVATMLNASILLANA